jgi:hypothetical protein
MQAQEASQDVGGSIEALLESTDWSKDLPSWMLTALENVFEASGNELALKGMCMHVYMH